MNTNSIAQLSRIVNQAFDLNDAMKSLRDELNNKAFSCPSKLKLYKFR